MRDEQVVGMSEVHMLSFTAAVMPDKGPPDGARVGLESFGRCAKALIRALRSSPRVAYVLVEARIRSLPRGFGGTRMS